MKKIKKQNLSEEKITFYVLNKNSKVSLFPKIENDTPINDFFGFHLRYGGMNNPEELLEEEIY